MLTSLFGDLGPGKDPDGKKAASSAEGEAPVAFGVVPSPTRSTEVWPASKYPAPTNDWCFTPR